MDCLCGLDGLSSRFTGRRERGPRGSPGTGRGGRAHLEPVVKVGRAPGARPGRGEAGRRGSGIGSWRGWPRKSQYISEVTGIKGLLWWLSGKECRRNCRRRGFHPWVRKIPWRRKWQPTPVFLPVKSRQWSLVGYSPWSRKELDVTQQPDNKKNNNNQN